MVGFVALALVGCRERAARSIASRSTGGQSANADSVRAAAAAESVAKAHDEWNRAEVVKRLGEAGLVVVDAKQPTHRDGLSIAGELLHVSGSNLEIYIYHDGDARRRDSAKLDTAATPFPPGSPQRPRYIMAGNLVAILFTANETLDERVENALMARHTR